MELVDGLNLEKARPNRLNTFLIIFQRVAQGLLAMHQAGFVHSDIKPTNIMLAKGGVLKIIDFGQSCAMNHRKERIQGTPDFIAPEQVKRMPLDARTDVFNLGATMYWLLTSQNYPTAIRGSDMRGGINLVDTSKPIAPVEINDKIPMALSRLVMECCSEKPSDRPSDMKQLLARLDVVQKQWHKHLESLRTERQLGSAAPIIVTPVAQVPAVAAESDEPPVEVPLAMSDSAAFSTDVLEDQLAHDEALHDEDQR